MIGKLFDTFFGCWHSHYSFPHTVRPGTRRNKASSVSGMYVVCLDCGKEMPYDWQEMKVTSPTEYQAEMHSLATKHAA